MENIFWILILVLIIQKILARAGNNNRFPGPLGRIPGNTGPGKDEPLPGPWNRPSDPEKQVEYSDVPLPGPWNRESGEETKKTPGGRNDGGGGQFSKDRNDREIAVQHDTVRLGDMGQTNRVPSPYEPLESKQKRERKSGRGTGRMARKKVVSPLYRYFNNRHGLAASIIISEVLNKRGGRRNNYR